VSVEVLGAAAAMEALSEPHPTSTPRPAVPSGAAQVAAAHHISERHLYNILGAGGITLADWIRTQRLQRCRNDIAGSAFHATPIASIARGWGFSDPSSFTRMFKNAYAMSPREWRHQANTRRSEPTGEVINQ
jgi:AraC-like DNA-binding protein